MTLRLGDTAPDFTAETTEGAISLHQYLGESWCNWNDGHDVIISPAYSEDEATKRFPKGFTALKPYLRLTPQPNR